MKSVCNVCFLFSTIQFSSTKCRLSLKGHILIKVPEKIGIALSFEETPLKDVNSLEKCSQNPFKR